MVFIIYLEPIILHVSVMMLNVHPGGVGYMIMLQGMCVIMDFMKSLVNN